MTKHINILPFWKAWLGFFLTLALVSCGTDSKHFRLDGRLLNLRQGEFTIYSPDGAMGSADTLNVVGSRFDFTGECLKEGTVVVVMPNGTEVPVFVEPGASLTMNGDAQNLDQVEVTGTKANEVMNDFRKASAGKSDRDIPAVVLEIIKQNPEEITGLYLIRRYLLSSDDYDDATKAVNMMLEEQEDNSVLTALRMQLKEMTSAEKGKGVPAFTTRTVDKKNISASMMRQGVAVVVSWASWDFNSVNLLRQIIALKKDVSQLTVMGLSFDADTSKATISLDGNSKDATWYNVCDGNMVDSHLAHLFSISQVPTVIIIKNGKIIERNLLGDKAVNKIKELCS